MTGQTRREPDPVTRSGRDHDTMSTTLNLFWGLLKRDLAARYARSLGGATWAVLQPLGQLLLFTFVFGTILKVPLLGEATSSFPIFLFAGLLPWLAFQEGLTRGTNALVEHAEFLKRHRLAPALLVSVRIASALVLELVGIGLFLAILWSRGEFAWQHCLWLFPALIVQGLLAFGLAGLLAPVQVLFRDLGQLLGLLLPAWFYATPIVYPLGLVPENLRCWISWQPLSSVVGAVRASLLGGLPPPLAEFGAALGLGVLLAGFGLLQLKRAQAWLADEL